MTQEQQRPDVTGMDPWGLRRVEQLLKMVEGVDSLKIVPDGKGGIDEVHVVSTSGLGAKQIVRNIESALLARFGLQVDHRKISIAQVSPQDLPQFEEQPEPEPEAAAAPERRLVLEGFHVDRRAGERVVCRVQLRDGEEVHEGQAQGPDYAKARLEVAAQAVLNTLVQTIEGERPFTIEGVSQVDLYGHRLVIVLVQARTGRKKTTLPGLAEIGDSLEEAVILACLGATNRWTTKPD